MFEIHYQLAKDKINRFRAEAENERFARSAMAGEPGPFERFARSMGQGLHRLAEKTKLESRPRPAI